MKQTLIACLALLLASSKIFASDLPADRASEVATPVPALRVKIALVGSVNGGKTALAHCLAGRQFNPAAPQTIGINTVTLDRVFDQRPTRIFLWDMPGVTSLFHYTVKNLIGAHGVMVVFNLTNKSSFNRAAEWLTLINTTFPQSGVDLVLVGTHGDLGEDRQVSSAEAHTLAHREGARFVETSAKSGSNCETALSTLYRYNTNLRMTRTPDSPISLRDQPIKKLRTHE